MGEYGKLMGSVRKNYRLNLRVPTYINIQGHMFKLFSIRKTWQQSFITATDEQNTPMRHGI